MIIITHISPTTNTLKKADVSVATLRPSSEQCTIKKHRCNYYEFTVDGARCCRLVMRMRCNNGTQQSAMVVPRSLFRSVCFSAIETL